MELTKHFDKLMGLLGFGPTVTSELFDMRLERCRLREARRVTTSVLFRMKPRHPAV
jgi:hypothetical protein